MVKHAWYSKKQSKVYSECEQWKCKEFVWLDKNNEEVYCTEVTDEKKTFWNDAIYLGLVYKYKQTIWKR